MKWKAEVAAIGEQRSKETQKLNKPELWMLCGMVSWDSFG